MADLKDLQDGHAFAESLVGARRTGPRCVCGHPAQDHEWFSGMCFADDPQDTSKLCSSCDEYCAGPHFADGRSAWCGQ